MKKSIILFIVLTLIFSLLTSCGNDDSNTTESTSSSTTTGAADTAKAIEAITEATTVKQLSLDCDRILCTGYDGNDYYELVANQIDGYPDSTFEVGVIKNNEWLLAMGSSVPFIDESGWWKGLDKDYQSNIIEDDAFKYMGSGCFSYKEELIYNPENQVYFENIILMSSEKLTSKEFVGCENRNSSGEGLVTGLYNLETGTVKKLKFFEDENHRKLIEIHDIRDGLFYAAGNVSRRNYFDYVEYEGFFNLEGEMVLDLTEYTITDYHGYVYKDGTYTITCKNNSDVNFDITFNTSGEIIFQEKSEYAN